MLFSFKVLFFALYSFDNTEKNLSTSTGSVELALVAARAKLRACERVLYATSVCIYAYVLTCMPGKSTPGWLSKKEEILWLTLQ